MINWKVRLKNKVWLMTAIPVVLGALYAVFGLFGWVPPIAETALENVLITVVGALAVLGIVEDPTTAGVKDSEQAMTYEKPKE
jgi:phi LC3 family holin